MAERNAENLENTTLSLEKPKDIPQIDAQIAQLETQKKALEESGPGSEDFQAKISDLVKKLEDLKAEKSNILATSQKANQENLADVEKNLENKPLSVEQQKQATTEMEKAGLNEEQKQKVQESMKSGEFNILDAFNGEGGILSVILSIFQNLMGYNSPDTSNDEFSVVPVKITEKHKLEFVKEAKVYALEVEQKYGIPWEVSLSQCILESGWGTSKSARKDGVYFGIKTKSGGVSYNTKEDYGNGFVSEVANFKKFNNMREAFLGYGEYIINCKNKGEFRYKSAFNYSSKVMFGLTTNYQGRDPVSFIKEVKNAGYATDSNYIGKIVSIQKGLEKIA